MTIQTRPFEVDDFSGGLTDYYLDAAPNQFRSGDNLIVRKHGQKGKIESRPGSAVYNEDFPQIPAGVQRVGTLINLDNDDELLVQSAKKLYWIDESLGFQTLLGPSGQDVFTVGDTLSALSHASWNHHLLLTSDAFPSVMKVYRDSSGTLQVRNAGLPRYATEPTYVTTSGANSYVYAFCYFYEYSVGTVSFVDLGATYQSLVENTADPSLSPIQINGIESIASGLENYDTANIRVHIYRTINGGTSLYYVDSVVNGTTTFVDTLDDDTLQTRPTIYTLGGVLDNDPPPRAKIVHVANDTAFYANITEGTENISNRIRQSVVGDPDSCPESFYLDLEDEIVGLSSVNGTPIALCRFGAYRIEGQFDELGRGGMVFQKISDSASCVGAQSVVQTIEGIFWAGQDGFYFCDGFRVQKISEELSETQRSLVSTALKSKRIVGTYDQANRQILWGVQRDDGSLDNDSLMILHLSFGIRPNSTFTTASNGTSFRPSALCIYRGDLIRGDTRGYVFRHNESFMTDPEVDLGKEVSDWASLPVVWDYESTAFNFGSSFLRKWVPRITVACQNRSNLSLQITSNNDDRRKIASLSEIRFRLNVSWGDPEVVWGDPKLVWNYDGMIEEQRRFPAGSLRCSFKQIGLTNAKVIVTKSDTLGLASVDQSLKTVTLDSFAASIWPELSVGYFIAFETDGYHNEFEVVGRTDDTLTVLDARGLLPQGSVKWVLRGIPKGEAFSLISYTIHYGVISSSQTQYKGETGGNE